MNISNIRAAAEAARKASHTIRRLSAGQRDALLLGIRDKLRAHKAQILEANAKDLEAGRAKGLSEAFLDRLALNAERVEEMAVAVEEIASQEDPVGLVEREWVRPNGLRVGKMRTPLGVICVIYEARPNVTSDAAALSIRSGNAIFLKGGSDAKHSNRAVGDAIAAALRDAQLPEAAVTVMTAQTRDEIAELLTFDDLLDLVIPRGGEGLIRFVSERSQIPVVAHYKGVCHVYVDESVDFAEATSILANAKLGRPAACNAAETVLVHAAHLDRLNQLVQPLRKAGVRLHADERAIKALEPGADVVAATAEDWDEEYLSLDIAIRTVDHIDEAIAHIQAHGSGHTEAILTSSLNASRYFVDSLDSSCIMVNASTRFADGGQLGLGAEIGISTSKIHAYGPMGAEGLTTTRFVVFGQGQVR